MNNLTTSQQQLEVQTLKHNLKEYLALALERTQTEPFNLDKTVNDITKEFPYLKDEDYMMALRFGGLGKYGRTYKFSTQEVCIWIREYIKGKKSDLGI